jgi:hypothetical protein
MPGGRNLREINMTRFFILSVICLFSFCLHAKTWKTSYLSFDLPDSWRCLAEKEPALSCFSNLPGQGSEAVIIMAGKIAGAEDTFQNYLKHLSQPKKIDKDGKVTYSKVVYVHQTKINGFEWADALHSDSEVREYMTRYLATVEDGIGILVTFTVKEKLLDKYSAEYMKTIQSIRPLKGVIGAKSGN